jgi:integrase
LCPIWKTAQVAPKKTEHGTWKVRWWEPETGRQRARTFKRKDLAVAFEKELHGDLVKGDYVPPSASKITVAAFADEWLAGARNLGAGGRETYRRDLDRHVIPTLGDIPLGKLTTEKIDALLTAKLEAGLAASTVHRIYRTVRRMCVVTVERGRLARNPCDPIVPPRIRRDEDLRILTADEVRLLADKITPRYRALILVAAYAGPRWSELIGLRRRDVDGDRITISGQLVRRADGEWHRDEPKTRAGRRTVTLPSFVAAELEHHMEEYSGEGPDALVFATKNGTPPIASSWTASTFKPACLTAGLGTKEKGSKTVQGAPRVHDLRHTAVALLISAGQHPKVIQARLGHASIGITMDTYGHLLESVDGDAAAALDTMYRPAVVTDPS